MKKFIFEELLMMSTREKRARRVVFHPETTIIRGANETGKSQLIKTLYQTFGATPPNFHPKWTEASVKSLVRFTVDRERYAILRDGSTYTLFDREDHRIGTYASISNDLAPALAKVFSFNLRLPLHNGEAEGQATPAFLFLPFYIDQDQGWHTQWASFERLQQFGRTRFQDTMEYHTGIRPNEFYAAKGKLLEAKTAQRPFQEKRDVLRGVLQDLQQKLAATRFDISIDDYAQEIEKLLEQSGMLREEEETLKNRLVTLYNARSVVRSQIAIASKAAQELASDFEYAAATSLEASVECPTCGASYDNKFQERFAIAEDEDSCQQLLVDLKEELRGIEESLSEARTAHTQKTSDLQAVEKLLETKQGEVTLRDILENEGKKEVHKILEGDVDRLNTEIGRLDGVIRAMQERMNALTNRDRKAEIIADYGKLLRRYLATLNVQPQPPAVYKRVDPKIKECGSDLPRALLAYQFSILQVICERSSSAFCPIVIDSPNQQDQDPANLKRIYEFIRDERPKDSQLVLALVDPSDVAFGGTTIELEDKYSVLRTEDYEAVSGGMRPLIDASMRA